MRNNGKVVIGFVIVGVISGFLVGAYKSAKCCIENKYVYYGMNELIIMTVKKFMNEWVLRNILISLIAVFLFLIFHWQLKLMKKKITSLADIRLKNPKHIYDLVVAATVSFLFFGIGGYLINHYLLPGFLEITSIIPNMGLLVLCICLVIPLSRIIKVQVYEKLKAILLKSKKSKIVKVSLISIISFVTALNLYLYIRKSTDKPRGPNVVLIVVDTLRRDHLSTYGYFRDTSPNIENLARGAKVFENCYSQSSWTLPSMATIMTGLYPTVHTATNLRKKLENRYLTIPEIMSNNFYTTIGIVSHLIVSSEFGFNQGFDLFDESAVLDSFSEAHKSITSDYLTKKAIKYIKENRDNKFFVYIHFFDPHYNFILHDQYNYFPKYDGELRNNQGIGELRSFRFKIKEKDIEYLRSLYDSEISYTDENIGKIIDELKRLNLYNNTMIIITADHGEEFMERDWIGHTKHLYCELINVPLIIKLSNSNEKSSRIRDDVGIIDILPTVLEACKINVNNQVKIQGRSLFNNMEKGKRDNIRDPVFSEVSFIEYGDNKEKQAFKECVIVGKWKMIKNLENDSYELYDLGRDKCEKENVVDYNHGIMVEMDRVLRIWEEKNKDLFKSEEDDTRKMKGELKEKLKSLGYIN